MSNTEYFGGESITEQNLAPAQRRLIDFQPDERFDGSVFAISDKQQRTAKNGKPYLTFRLRDSTGERDAKWFSPPEDALQKLDGAQLVRVQGTVESQRAFSGDFKIEACEAVETPADLTSFLPPLPADHQAHRARFFDVIRAVKSAPLKALLKEIFRLDGEFWELFETAPAAKKMHHAYRGGLLEHSGEVAILCERIASTLPHLDRDLLLTAALLHDIGKVEEMKGDLAAGEYTAAGHLVGHVILGTCTVAAAIEKIEGFPIALKHELMHLILSHHGRLEHGAVKPPMCAEAVVLSQCDLMSAKTAQCREKVTDGVENDFLTGREAYGWEEEKLYLGAMRRVFNNAAQNDEE